MDLIRQLSTWIARGTEGEDLLIRAAQQGDRRAFDDLISVYTTELRGFVRRRVGPQAVEDVLQEVWLAGWVGLPRFNHRARFKTWLYGIALHKCNDYHRNQSHNLSLSMEAEIDPGSQSIEELYAAAELRETVQSLLAQLPDEQREVLEMYYYAELTLPEIAEILKRNLNTVKYQFYRAHERIGKGLRSTGQAVVTDRQSAVCRPGLP